MAYIEVKNLTFQYPDVTKDALDEISLQIEQGEFVVVCGKSGCGKSTLLRHFKTVLTPFGTRQGEILFEGKPLEEADLREQTTKIGYVLQNPDNQIVTDKVWHELAFGLESLGYDKEIIRLRVAEMASYFGIQEWYHKNVSELSGGQKQMLNLASVMAMQPQVLILDEPTSQLDPIAAADFFATLRKINDEIGTTIILSEHRLEDALPKADRVIVLSDGKIICDGIPAKIGCDLKDLNDPMLLAMPAPMRLYLELEKDYRQDKCPVTVKEGAKYLSKYPPSNHEPSHEAPPDSAKAETIIKLREVWFRYEKEEDDIVKDLSLEIKKGELYCIVGGNGAGKTTLVKILSGINRPYRGKIFIEGQDVTKKIQKGELLDSITLLPQDPQTLFVKSTVRDDLRVMLSGLKMTKEEKTARTNEIAELTEVTDLMDMHPYDVSGGEQQRVALAKVLLTDPEILLLDEPTKGMDSFFKEKFADILKKLLNKGVSIIIVSHDIEFCATHGEKCALFFDGSVVTENTPREFFAGNSFYTTAVNRMCRKQFRYAITVKDVVELCK